MTMTDHEVGADLVLVASDVAIEFTPEQEAQRVKDTALYYSGRSYYDPRDTRRAIGRYLPTGQVEYFVEQR